MELKRLEPLPRSDHYGIAFKIGGLQFLTPPGKATLQTCGMESEVVSDEGAVEEPVQDALNPEEIEETEEAEDVAAGTSSGKPIRKRKRNRKNDFVEFSEIKDELNPWAKLGERKNTLVLSYVQKIQKETQEQREKRLEHIRRLNRQRLQTETPEQRERRLKVLRENSRKRRNRLIAERGLEDVRRKRKEFRVYDESDSLNGPVDIEKLQLAENKERYAPLQVTALKANEFLTGLEQQRIINRGVQFPDKQIYVLHSFWAEGIIIKTLDAIPKSPLPLIQLPQGLIKPYFAAYQGTSRYLQTFDYFQELGDNAKTKGADLNGFPMTYKEWVEFGMPDTDMTPDIEGGYFEKEFLEVDMKQTLKPGQSQASTLLFAQVKEEIEENPMPIIDSELSDQITDVSTMSDEKKDVVKMC
ncbi:unnamed protein product, partial [Mesorhabditis belari]|uniref:Uncharacterized protein n=1 Tax=Mesorhabditis belari TaxID=2138241 RepID=A0AAF3EB77_9BILA